MKKYQITLRGYYRGVELHVGFDPGQKLPKVRSGWFVYCGDSKMAGPFKSKVAADAARLGWTQEAEVTL